MSSRVLVGSLILLLAGPAAAATSLTEAWLRVQFALATESPEALDERARELREAATEVSTRRLTPYAAALATWAEEHPGEVGEVVLDLARELDASMPSASFLEARWRWREGAYPSAASAYLAGWSHLVRDRDSRRTLVSSSGVWFLFALGLTLAVAVVLQTLGHLRELAHDALELGLVLFKRANATVFAVVVLALPLFAGLGPIWLVAYLFAMCWIYMGVNQRVAAITTCIAMAAVLPGLEIWQRTALRVPSVSERVVQMLDDRRLDPATLRELAELEGELDGVAEYHLILGELLRMQGDIEAARLQYKKASLADPSSAVPLVFLGNLSLEDGDFARALEQYNMALHRDERSAITYYNLSTCYDLSRRFQDGDSAREKARELAGRRPQELGLAGRDERIRYPWLGRAETAAMLAEVPEDARAMAALSQPGVRVTRHLRSSMTVAFALTGLLGVVILAVRGRLMWVASSCTRCGKVFCPRCKSATESSIYCSQCISVFLKRDKVSIEQQSAKLEQVRRWEALSSAARRVVGMLLPGGNLILEGRVAAGLLYGFAAWSCLTGAVVWMPRFLPSVEPLAATLPLQLTLGLAFAALWGRSAAAAWHRR